MLNFTKLVGENGAMTAEGKVFFTSLVKQVDLHLDLNGMSTDEVRHVGVLLHKVVGDFISESLQNKLSVEK